MVDSIAVEAAGGLLWRISPDGELEVAVVHRPRYDDWSFPKGKCDPGESHRETAVREVAEETGLAVAVGAELPEVRYDDHKGRSKRVRYWAMEVTGGRFAINDEVDELRWLGLEDAAQLLSYADDRSLLADLASSAGP